MKRRWICMAAGIVLTALVAAGCMKREELPVQAEENSQTLCGKVQSVDGNQVVLEIGTVDDFEKTPQTDAQEDCFGGILTFTPSGEMKTIEIADNAAISTMNGVKKTEATVAELGTGDILAVTLSRDMAVKIVIHQVQLSGESS